VDYWMRGTVRETSFSFCLKLLDEVWSRSHAHTHNACYDLPMKASSLFLEMRVRL